MSNIITHINMYVLCITYVICMCIYILIQMYNNVCGANGENLEREKKDIKKSKMNE